MINDIAAVNLISVFMEFIRRALVFVFVGGRRECACQVFD
jgi:hypothetical protein